MPVCKQEIDPDTGRYVPVPFDFAAYFGSKRPNQDWSSSNNNNFQSYQPIKYRKTERGVRKELFKLPPQNVQKVKITAKDTKHKPVARRSLIKSLPSKNDSIQPAAKKTDSNDTAQMVTITEELEPKEQPVIPKGYPFKVATPQVKFSEKAKEEDVKTPESFETNNGSFLRLEQLCESPLTIKESPVSSVCNLFQSNMFLNSEKKNVDYHGKSQKDIIAEIRRTIKENQELYHKTTNKIKEIVELQTLQEQNHRRIISLVDELDGDSTQSTSKTNDDEKENSSKKRRSLRLQNRSPTQNLAQPAGSPVILKAGDLRKSTLTKSLVSKCNKYQINSPRIQKAIDMYNSTRNVCSALLTPKISRSQLAESPNIANWRSNLCEKVQEQCLMLQDTPVHK